MSENVAHIEVTRNDDGDWHVDLWRMGTWSGFVAESLEQVMVATTENLTKRLAAEAMQAETREATP